MIPKHNEKKQGHMVLSMALWKPSKQPLKHNNKKQGHKVLWMVAWKTFQASTKLNYSTTMFKEKQNRHKEQSKKTIDIF